MACKETAIPNQQSVDIRFIYYSIHHQFVFAECFIWPCLSIIIRVTVDSDAKKKKKIKKHAAEKWAMRGKTIWESHMKKETGWILDYSQS